MLSSCNVRCRSARFGDWCFDQGKALAQNGARTQALQPHSRTPQPTMIKLTAIEPKHGYQMLLRFSDGASGVFDFSRLIDAGTEMTEPLRDPAFFARHFIELGALAWPNGLDFSAESLHRRLQDEGKLAAGKKVA